MSFDRWSAATEVVVGLVRFGGRGAPEVIPHICQFWHTTALLRPVKYTKKCVNSRQNSQNFAKKYTSSKIVHQHRLWQLRLIWAMDEPPVWSWSKLHLSGEQYVQDFQVVNYWWNSMAGHFISLYKFSIFTAECFAHAVVGVILFKTSILNDHFMESCTIGRL